MAALEYTIKLENITAVGATCSDFNITWDDTLACGNITCVIKDNEITVQIPEECRGECIEAVIECTEPCTNCVPQRVTICPCETNADCDSCSSCVDNLCVSICDDDEFCEDAQCKECNDANPCPDGKVCVNGRCECPSGLFLNDKGQCVPCLPENTPNCFICTPDGLIPVECVDGVCDPETGDCVDCIGGGDCGPNEKCLDGECVCKDGFVRNPVTGECEPAPECDKDSDCPDCEECNQFGTCEPIQCPDGQVCVDGECKTPCDNGVDCPDGYGCDPDTGFCEKCSDQDCTTAECARLLGCECNSSGDCVDSDNCDRSECNALSDCPEGCVCYRGQCVDCSNFACDDCSVPGCECVSGNCQSDPDYQCNDSVEIVKVDSTCDLRGEARIKDACSCDPITITMKATDVVSSSNTTVTLTLNFDIRKGSANTFGEASSLPVLDNTSHPDIADNDVPDSGSILIKQVISIAEVDSNDNIIPGTQDNREVTPGTISFSGVASNTYDVTIYKKGSIVTLDSVRYRVLSVSLSAVQNSSFDFTSGSGCIYRPSNTITNVQISTSQFNSFVNGTLNYLNKFKTLFSEDERNPLFKWFRNSPTSNSYNNNTDVFLKVYVPATQTGYYQYTLENPSENGGELWSLYGYALEVDCVCGENYDDFGKVKFCQPEELTADFNECNTEVTIDGFDVCDVNSDLSGIAGTPANAQVYYELYINGERVGGDFVYNGTTLEATTGENLFDPITHTEPITTVKLVQRTSAGIICEKVLDVEPLEKRNIKIKEIDCDLDDKFRVRIDKDQNPVDISGISGGFLESADGTYLIKSFPKGDSATVTVTFVDGCKQELVLDTNCCEEVTVNIDNYTAVGLGTEIIPFSVSNVKYPISYSVVKSTGSQVVSGQIGLGELPQFSINNPTDGDYILTITDALGCGPFERQFSISVPEEPQLTVSNCSDFFTGESKEITLRVNADAIGGTLQYTDTDTSSSVPTTTNESLTFNSAEKTINITRSTILEFNTFEVDGRVTSLNQRCEINEISTPSVSSVVAEPDAVCLGESFDITVQGTPGATVSVSNVGDIILNSSGVGTVSVTPSSVGVKTYTANRIVLGTFNEAIIGPSETVNVSTAPVVDVSAECENNNPTSNRIVTIEVADSGGVLSVVDQETGDPVAFTGGSTGPNTSVYTVTLNSSTTIDILEVTYTNALGCSVSAIQGVPISCDCPNADSTVTVSDVCVGTGDNMVFEVTSVEVEGVTYNSGQFSVEWKEVDGTSLSTSNPFNYSTSGLPAGTVQLRYDVEITTGVHNGCTDTGFVSGNVLSAQQTLITPTTGDLPNNEICSNTSREFFSTLEGSSYAWELDGVPVGSNSRFYTMNEGSGVYELSVTVVDSNGCSATASRTISVVPCDCNVQYVDIDATAAATMTLTTLVMGDGAEYTLNDRPLGCPGGLQASRNDSIVARLDEILTSVEGSGSRSIFWQSIDVDCGVRFYILNSNSIVDKIQAQVNSPATNQVEYTFTKDCTSATAPGCTDSDADNYNASLNNPANTGGITITDDGTCTQMYYTALFATSLIEEITAEDITLEYNGNAPQTLASGSDSGLTIGGNTYQYRLLNQLNTKATNEGYGLVAVAPTATEIANDSTLSNLGTEGSVIVGLPGGGTATTECTDKTEYIRLYWPADAEFIITGTENLGESPAYISVNGNSAFSYTVRKCTDLSGGAAGTFSNTVTGLQSVDISDVPV